MNGHATTDLEHRAAIAEAELLASAEEIRVLELQRDQLLALLEAAARERAAAEFWLEDHRRSFSWRLTAPLRAVTQRSGGIERKARG